MSSEELKTRPKQENKKKRKLVKDPDFKLLNSVRKSSRTEDAKPWKEREPSPVPVFNAPPLPPQEALNRAINLADIDYIQHCLSNGASAQDVDFRASDGKKSLFYTVVEKNNNEETALLMLQGRVDFSERHKSDSFDTSVLRSCSLVDFAIKHNADKLLAKLLEVSADVYSNYAGKLWVLAAYYGSDRVMKRLITQGRCSAVSDTSTSADMSEPKMVSALERACAQRSIQSRLECIELLFKKYGSEKDSINDCFCVAGYLRQLCDYKDIYENMKMQIKVHKAESRFEMHRKKLSEDLKVVYNDLQALEERLSQNQKAYKASSFGLLFETMLSQLELFMQDLGKLRQEEFPPIEWGAKKPNTRRPIGPQIDNEEDDEEEEDDHPVFKLSRTGGLPL